MNLKDQTVDTTNKMLRNQARRYYKYNVRRMESKPIFCRYYNISNADSMGSKGMGQVYDWLSPDSPVRYNRINNTPLYAFKEFNRETRKTDIKGITIELDNESLILPGFYPQVGDLLVISLPGAKELMFRVTRADANTILQEPHHHITYTYYTVSDKDPDKFTQLEKQTVGNYDFVMGNVGDNKATIIDIGTVAYIRKLVATYARINNEYLETFYNEEYNLLLYSHVCEDNPEHPIDMIYYSPMLVEFQRRMRPIMYEFSQKYVGELILTHEDMTPFDFEKSMYGDITYDDLSSFLGNFSRFDVKEFEVGGRYTKLMKWFPKQRYLTQLNQFASPNVALMSIGIPSDKTAEYLIKDSSNVKKIPTLAELDSLQKSSEKLLNSDSDIISSIMRIAEDPASILDETVDLEVDDTLEDFLIVPIILYLLKLTIDGAQKDPKFLLDDLAEVKR